MKKIVTIIGARPQFIKAAAISRLIQSSFSDQLQEVIIHTGQHYDENMSEIFFDELNIPRPNYNLESGSGERKEQIKLMVHGIFDILEKEKPDLVLVYGDTNSTLAGATAGYNHGVPIAHVEAGLRSFNEDMPEERNRIRTDKQSVLLFCPTEEAITNLKNEEFSLKDNISSANYEDPFIQLTGDIMLDNTLFFANIAKRKSTILRDLGIEDQEFVLATCHRPSNTDQAENLNSIFQALADLCENENTYVVLPMHPRTRKMYDQYLNSNLKDRIEKLDKFILTTPVSFLDMVLLESASKMIITDSGGVQKEAFFLKKPCIVLRNETEWVELVENGNAILAGPNREKIQKAYTSLMKNSFSYPEFYGDGSASNTICKSILKFLNR